MFVPESKDAIKVYEQKNAINKNDTLGNYFITKEKYEELKGFEVFPGDIIVSCAGTIGETFVMPNSMRKGIINQALMKISLYNSSIKDFYLIYFDCKLKALANEQGYGMALKNIPPFDILKQYLVPLPPLPEQRRIIYKINIISNVLTVIDNHIDKISIDISNIKSKILDLAIRGKLVPQDPSDEPASVLLERIREEKEELIKQGKIKRDKKESVIFKDDDNSYYEKMGQKTICIDEEITFEIPDSWRFVRLKCIWELLSGRDLIPSQYNNDENGIPYITGASNFSDGKVNPIRWTTTPQVITDCGDILITCKGTVGEMAINNFGKAHIARQVMAIRNIHNLNTEYLYLCIKFYIESIKLSAKGLIPGISREDLLNIILPIPPLVYQQRVVNSVCKYNNILNDIEASLN